MASIDLSKLKPLDLPTGEIEVEISGEKQTVKFHAITGSGAMALMTLPPGKVERLNLLYLTYLCYGLDISESEAKRLMDAEPVVAVNIADAIYRISETFAEAKKKEQEDAKKN